MKTVQYFLLIALMGCGAGSQSDSQNMVTDVASDVVTAELENDTSGDDDQKDVSNQDICSPPFPSFQPKGGGGPGLSVQNIWTEEELASLPIGKQGVVRTVLQGFDIVELQVTMAGKVSITPDSTTPFSLFYGVAEWCSENPWQKWGGAAGGMSGSPIIIEGHIAAALSYGLSGPENAEPFQFGATPAWLMAEMEGKAPGVHAASKPGSSQSESGMQPLGLISISGGLRAIDFYQEAMNELGITPAFRLATAGSARGIKDADIPELVPGSGIAIPLIMPDGDEGIVAMAAIGTVTMIDGNRLWAFGHPMSMAGKVALPYTAAWIDGTYADSFGASKIGVAVGPILGSIVEDRTAGIVGIKGFMPKMIKTIGTVRFGDQFQVFRHLVTDTSLTPTIIPLEYLIGMATMQPVDTIVNQIGAKATLVASFKVWVAGSAAPAEFRIITSSADPVGELGWRLYYPIQSLMNGFGIVTIEQVESDVTYKPGLQIVNLYRLELPEEIASGEPLTATLHYHLADKWAEQTKEFTFVLPADFKPGASITVTISSNSNYYGGQGMFELDEECNPIYPQSAEEWVKYFNSIQTSSDTVEVVIETANTGLADCQKACAAVEAEADPEVDGGTGGDPPVSPPESDPKGGGGGDVPPPLPGDPSSNNGATPCAKACAAEFKCSKPIQMVVPWTVPNHVINGSVSATTQITAEEAPEK